MKERHQVAKKTSQRRANLLEAIVIITGRLAVAAKLVVTACLAASAAAAQSAEPLVLSSAVIRGSNVYDHAELFPVYRDHLGKPISQAQVRAIAGAIAERYAADGYPRPQIRLDDDLVAFGVLRIDIYETRIGGVSVKGNPGPHRERLETLGARLQAHDVLKQSDLHRTLRQMRDLPGLTLSATTTAESPTPSLYVLDLETEFQAVSGVVRVTNRGTDEAGPNFLLGQLMANGLFGGQTSLGLSFGAAFDYGEYRGMGVLANRRIGIDGLVLSLSAFRSRANPHEAPVDREDRFVRDRVKLGATKRFARTGGDVLSLTAALDLEDLVIFREVAALRDERLRMLELSAHRSWRGAGSSQYAAGFDVVKGLGGLGSGLNAADLTADPRRADFLLLRATTTRVTRINEAWSWRLDALAQHTADVLPYGERFKIGGDRLGRGFEVPEIAGDQGIGAKVELRRRLRELTTPESSLSAYAFYDIGATFKQDAPGRESAATSGVGIRLQGRRMSGSLELAKPLTHADVEGRRDLSAFAEITVRL